MNLELNKDSSFGDIEKWYNDNIDILPTTLDTEHLFYNNVPFLVNLYLNQVYDEAKRLGIKNIKKSSVAKSAKHNLFTLYVHLKDVEKWDAPRPTLNTLNKRI